MNAVNALTGNLINEKSIARCLKYSDNPDRIKGLLSELEITSVYIGLEKYFSDDTEPRIKLMITIQRGERCKCSFTFGLSIMDSMLLFWNQYSDKELLKVFRPFKNKYVLNDISDLKKELTYNYKKNIQTVFNDLLYSVLSSVHLEYYCPTSFSEFCSEFGYDEDSIKAHDLFIRCGEQASKLKRIFTDEDVECLPS